MGSIITNPIAIELGTPVVLSGSDTITSANGTFENIISMSLPGAGRYLLFGRVRGAINLQALSPAGFIRAKFRNTTDSVDVADSEVMVVYTLPTLVTVIDTVPIEAVLTVSGPKTIGLQAASQDGNFAARQIDSDANGRTWINYMRWPS